MLNNSRTIKIAIVLLVSLLLSGTAFAQINYTFSAVSGTFTPLTGATTLTPTGGTDDGYYNNVPIGFTFTYNAIPYAWLSAGTNGYCVLEGLNPSSLTNNLTSGTPRPIIAPFWDDLDMELGTFSYKTEGTAPNQVFTAEWLNVEWYYGASVPVISFQVKLYQATGNIEFIYRQEPNSPVSPSGASIGITAVATGSGNFLSLDGTGPSPNASSTLETTTLITRPATGQIYRFSRPQITIAHIPLTSTGSTAPRLVSADITALQGLAGSPNQPRLYYRSGTTGPYTSIAMTNPSGNTWQATIPGYPVGTTVQYYIAAQDLATPPNVVTAPSGGSGVNPPGTTPPATPYSYTIIPVYIYYSFQAASGTFTPLTGATVLTPTGGTYDDDYYNNVPIGFTFTYNGIAYNWLSAGTNGWAVLEGLNPSSLTNNLTSGTPRPILAPLWDDLHMGLGTFSYKTEGTAPNQVFTAEWLNVQWYYGTGVPVISFQMKLYQATGNVEFIYRQEPNPPVSASASIGITAVGTGSGNFLSLDGTGTSPNASPTLETTTLSVAPATGQIYRFIALPVPPTITHIPLTNSSSSASRLVTATIISTVGLAGSPNQPRLYYRPGTSGAYSSTAMTNPSGNTWQATIPGYPGGTVVQYYIAAQDTLTPPYVTTAPAGGSGANPPGSTPPPVVYQYVVTLPISGNFTINIDGGGNYLSFAEAFAVLNACGLSGPATFTVTGTASTVTYPECNLTLGGVGSALLTTLSSTNTLTFVAAPSKTINVSGTGTGTTDFAFRLMGVDYVVFDGINIVEVGTTDAARLEYGYIINNVSSVDGATYNTIKNFSVTLAKVNANGTVGAIIANGTAVLGTVIGTAGTISSRCNFNKIQNFLINNTRRGISFDGLPIPAFDEGNEVSGHPFTSATGGTWVGGSRIFNWGSTIAGTDWGIGIDGQKNLKVFNVQIDSGSTTGAAIALSGIHFGTAASTCDGADNTQIYNCVIRNIENTGVATAFTNGIRASATTLHTVKIYNCAIYDIRSALTTSTTGGLSGINFDGPGAASKLELYYNSINITGATGAAGVAKGIRTSSASLFIVGWNNAVQVTGGGATGGAVGIEFGGPPTSVELFNNVYNVGVTSASRSVGMFGATRRQNLVDWQSTLLTSPSDGIDQGSGYGEPGYNGSTDLTIGTTGNRVNNSGIPNISFPVGTDILGATRSSTIPDIGVFEGNFSAGFTDAGTPRIAIAPFDGSIGAEIPVNIRDNVETGANLTATLWYRLGTTGAFTSLAPDFTPVNATNGIYRWSTSLRALPAGTYQYYVAARDAAGNTFISPTMTVGATFPGFLVSPGPAGWAGTNPFASAGVRTFVNLGTTLAGGTYTVGTGETYASLTAAVADLNARPISGNVIFELTNNYTGAGEVFPIVINQPAYVSTGPLSPDLQSGFSSDPSKTVFTVTIRPAASVTTPRVTEGDPGTGNALIVLDQARYVILDGRPGGTGTNRMWRITNTRSAATIGEAIRLVNDASRNIIRYIITESNTQTSGVIGILGTFSGGLGNNNNLIDNCEIRDYALGTAVPPNPAKCIISSGSGSGAGFNQNNAITNNLLYNFHSTTTNPMGIYMANSVGFTITGNHIYQTAPRTGIISLTCGIYIAAATGAGHTINGNFIGGSEPNCGGAPFTFTSTSGIYAIDVSLGSSTTPSTIENNTVANINHTTSIAASTFAIMGVFARAGNQVPILINNNTIGNTLVDATVNPSIILTATLNTDAIATGVLAVAGLNTITNNRIGGIRTQGTGTGTARFNGIFAQTAGFPTISDNIIGSLTVANNIHQASTGLVNGIFTSIGGNIMNNTIANLTTTATTGTVGSRGIQVSGGIANIVGNTVRDIVSPNISTWTDYDAAVAGIDVYSSTANQLIERNVIHSLTASHSGTTNTTAHGIRVASGTGRVLRNRIYNIVNQSTGTAPNLFGINVAGGSWTLVNNMISLGDGLSNNLIIHGLRDAGTGVDKFFYNSVNITGAVTTGANKSYVFIRTSTAIDTLRNNIFTNFRTGGTGSHFAIGTGTTGWGSGTSNYNDLYAVTSTTVGEWGTTAYGFAGWKTASLGDANSINAEPGFVSVTDLHINPNSLVPNRKAIPITGITTDFDGEARHPIYPDIGADEYSLAAPAAPVLISPANSAINQPLIGQLLWHKSILADFYDVYLDAVNPPVTKVSALQTDTFYDYSVIPNMTYYWKVVAQNDTGVVEGSTSSAVWSFQTEIWDAGATAIIKPSAIGFAGNVIIPKVKVKNFGSAMIPSFPVIMNIGSVYTNTKTVNNLMAGDSLVVNFDPWTAVLGTYNLLAYTCLELDNNYANDTVRGSVEIQPPAHNVGTMEIIAPMDTIVEGDIVTPRAMIKNFGAFTENFTVRFKIGTVYNQTVTISNFVTGAETVVSFPNWTAVRCNYVVSCSTELAIDQLPEDDKMTDMVTVKYNDVGVVAILAPRDTVITCNDYTPMVVISNNGVHTYPALCSVMVKILRYPAQMTSYCNIGPAPTADVIYESWMVTELSMDEVDTLYFPEWHPYWWDIYWTLDPTYHMVIAEVKMAADMNSENDMLEEELIAKGRSNDLQMNWTGLLNGYTPMHAETLVVGTYNVASVVSNSPMGPSAKFRAKVKIIRENTNSIAYSRYEDRTLAAQSYTCIAFQTGWSPSDTGWYLVRSWLETRDGVDVVQENNSWEKEYYFTNSGPGENGIAKTNASAQNSGSANVPTTFGLMANRPNPFMTHTTIQWQIPVKSNVAISIYDATGRIVKTLVNGSYTAGYYNVTWDRSDEKHNKVASGIYFFEMRADKYSARHKMIITN